MRENRLQIPAFSSILLFAQVLILRHHLLFSFLECGDFPPITRIGCAYFTYVPEQSMCYLKRSKGHDVRDSPGMISGHAH